LVFLDYRMPPGGNGVETLRHLWAVHPSQRVVLCSAYSDYSWGEIVAEFGETPLLRELRKPVDGNELRRLAHTLTEP
jgi:DNA-binding NarL/FixJ family response regulator